MLTPADLSGGAEAFLAAQSFAVLTARNSAGELWTSPLTGAPGFMRGDADGLTVAAIPRLGDPLRDLPTDQPVGLIAVDFAARRRLRINGLLTAVTAAIEIRAEQAYGNCPQYIQRRNPNTTALATEPAEVARHSAGLTTAERGLITAADTFFLGTTHPTRGSDASSRKGGRLDSCGWIPTPDCRGRIFRVTTCSTVSGISPSMTRRRCCSSTSQLGTPCTSPVPPVCSGLIWARRATKLGGVSPLLSPRSWRDRSHRSRVAGTESHTAAGWHKRGHK